MKHSANIEPSVSRSFDLPLESLGGRLMAFCPPAFDGEWCPLPGRFVEGIDFASSFVGSKHSFPDGKFVCYVHVASGKVYATDNAAAVEYDLGEDCALALELSAKQVRAIKAFGAPPSHAAAGDMLEFGWSDGRRLAMTPNHAYHADAIKKVLDSLDWDDFHEVDEKWRAQIAGHFAFKTVRNESGLLRIRPGSIAGGIFDTRFDTELRIETYVDREVVFSKAAFLNAVKVATSIKFIHDGDHSRLLFRGENVRGVAASRHRVSS